MSKFLFTISFLFLCTSFTLSGTEQGYIEWKPIKGAFGYKLYDLISKVAQEHPRA